MKKQQSRTKLIQMAQVFRKQLKMDDETFALLKQNTVGKSSLSEMGVMEIKLIINALRVKGAESNGGPQQFPVTANHKMASVNKIKAIWITMHKQGFIENGSVDALNAWISRTTDQMNGGMGVERIEWLSNYKTSVKVLEALKLWHKRVMLRDLKQQYDVDSSTLPAAYSDVCEMFARIIEAEAPCT